MRISGAHLSAKAHAQLIALMMRAGVGLRLSRQSAPSSERQRESARARERASERERDSKSSPEWALPLSANTAQTGSQRHSNDTYNTREPFDTAAAAKEEQEEGRDGRPREDRDVP